MTHQGDAKVRLAWIALAVLGFLLLRIPFASLPLDRDEGEYAYIGWRLLEGEVPYRDAFDQKPPGIFAAYAVAFALGGRSAEAVHVLLWLWSAATALCVALLVRRLAGELASAGALLLFALAAADPGLHATAANTEAFLLLPMAASMLTLERGLAGDRARCWLATGALVAAACWFKQVAATHAVLVALAALFAPPGGRSRAAAWLVRLLWMALGGLLVSAPLIAFFGAHGAGAQLIDAVLLHNVAYARRRSWSQALDNLRFALGRQAGLLPLWLLAAFATLRPALLGTRGWALLTGWLVTSLAGVAVGLQFRPHYFVQALPALAALGGVGLARACQRLGGDGLVRRRSLAIGAALLIVALPLWAHRDVLLAGSSERMARRLYGFNPFPEAVGIARHIASRSTPEESVFVVGSEPQILFYAGRPSATRYIFFYPLTGGYADSLERQREVMEEVGARRPRYVVWVEVSTSLLRSEATELHVFESTRALLSRSYRLELVVRPDARHEGYEFVYGDEAARWLAGERDRPEGLPWLAVYRRSP